MSTDIPVWLETQTIADIQALSRALSDSDLASIERAGRKIGQDIRYIREFRSGLVRRKGSNR